MMTEADTLAYYDGALKALWDIVGSGSNRPGHREEVEAAVLKRTGWTTDQIDANIDHRLDNGIPSPLQEPFTEEQLRLEREGHDMVYEIL